MFKSILKTSILADTFLFFVTGCTVSRNSDPIAKEYDKVQTTKQHLEVAAEMQKDVTTQACDNPEIVTTCKTNMDIRKQLADLIAQAEYSCIDTQELARLSTLLNNTKQEVANKCTIITRTIETETIVPALKQIIKVK